MTDERKYGEEEVEEIFDLVVRDEVERPVAPAEGGLTLAEIQEVGREVGMEPGRIAEAALALDTRRGGLPRRTFLGIPVSVGRIVELPRAVTDHEWELLVAELRETFGARGHLTSHGGTRGWTNGNLHVFLEPTETGHRLRMRTLKGGAMALYRMGIAGLAMGLILFTVSVLTGDLLSIRTLFRPLLLAGMGAGALASNMLSLPRWAREREGQMEYIAGRVVALIGERPEEEEPGT